MEPVGIEQIHIYPTSMSLQLDQLAERRGFDVDYLHNEVMAYERGINPPWEDPVTMAVNAALPLLSEEEKRSIGLLIVGTETGLDHEKSLSTWVHRYLGLPSNCRNFEIKSACYSGTAALKMATNWLLSGTTKPGQKALIITTDQSLNLVEKDGEFVSGAGAVAFVVSNQPNFLQIEPKKYGVYSHEVADVIRPLPWIETGNSSVSLFSYIEGLTGAYEDYIETVGDIDFDEYFQYNIYHVPFSGISFRAHKQLMQLNASRTKAEIQESFNTKTLPAIQFAKRTGGVYGGSVFIAMVSLFLHAEGLNVGDRIGIFSYGSGSCAEFYSGIACERSKQIAEQTNLLSKLDQRHSISINEYEKLEHWRFEALQKEDITIDQSLFPGVYESQYEGKGLLVFSESKGYYRHYEFS